MSVESKTKILAGHLVRNYFATLEHPVSERGFFLTFFKARERLREQGMNPSVDFYNSNLDNELSYWAGHRFLLPVGYDEKEGQVWFMPKETCLVFKRDLEWVNRGFTDEVREILGQIIVWADQEVYSQSVASHPMMLKLIELQREVRVLSKQIFSNK